MKLKELLENLPEGTQKWCLLAVPYEEEPQAIKCATEPATVAEAPPVVEAPEGAPVERPAGCRCPDFSVAFDVGDPTCKQCASREQCARAMVR